MSAGLLSGRGALIGYAQQVTIVSSPPALNPGAPLNGGGVGGTMLLTWTFPPRTVFAGWVPTGETWETPTQLEGLQLQAYYPEPVNIPYDAGPEPEGGGTFTIIRVVPPGGWMTEL